ncbi:MAG: CHC2 zinc finger domain-containing protein [Ruminococcus sp.]|jgi:hypothetical protein|nr:CHC2 zinc finger domain-containing protein [Ruminococcus sp.]
MSLYETVKEQLDLRSVAEHYGINSRNGMTACIFHDDRSPSMKLYADHYYCFGCSACGDVTAFTARLFGISQAEAAQKLASDFGIAELHNTVKPSIKSQLTIIGERQREQEAFRVLCDYCHLLRFARTELAPKSESEPFHPLFIESLQHLEEYEFYCDIFISGSKEERTKFMNERRNFLNELKRKLYAPLERAETIA